MPGINTDFERWAQQAADRLVENDELPLEQEYESVRRSCYPPNGKYTPEQLDESENQE